MSVIGISGKIGSGKDTVARIIQKLQIKNKTPQRNIEGLSQDQIESLSEWKTHRFADEIKDTVCRWIGCTREQLEDREFKEKPLGEEWHVWKLHDGIELHIFNSKDKRDNYLSYLREEMFGIYEESSISDERLTPRRLMQLLGTDCGREIIHPDIWVNALFADYKKQFNDDDFHDIVVEEGLINPKKEGNIHALRKLGLRDGKINSQLPDKYKTRYPNWIIPDTRFPNEAKAIKDRNGILIRVERPIEYGFPQRWKQYIETQEANSKLNDTFEEFWRRNDEKFYNKITHPSETDLDDWEDWDYIIENNGTLDDLLVKVEKVYNDLE